LGPRRRAGLRQEDRRGRPRAGAAGCERHQGLPRRRRRSGMTLPQMLAAHARRYGRGKVALREKKYGIWQEVTWEDYAAHVRAHLPRLERIVVDDTRGLEDYREPLLTSLEEVERLGREADARDPGHYDALLARGTTNDVALLAYTSGTTAVPKAAMICHRNLL